MTWLEMAPVGDAWSAPRTRVRRLDKLYQFTLNLVFPSTTVSVNNYLVAVLLVEKRRRSGSDQVGLWFGVLKPFSVQVTRPQLSRRYVRALSPVSSRIFTSSSIYD